jgi:hypothetical protein
MSSNSPLWIKSFPKNGGATVPVALSGVAPDSFRAPPGEDVKCRRLEINAGNPKGIAIIQPSVDAQRLRWVNAPNKYQP